jgi:hypothetical protein
MEGHGCDWIGTAGRNEELIIVDSRRWSGKTCHSRRLFPLIVCLLSIVTIAGAEDRKTASDQGKLIITDVDIKKMNVHLMVELLNQVPGVSAGGTTADLILKNMI